MADVQVQDKVTSTDGEVQSGRVSTTQSVLDPVTGAETRQSSTHMWSGRSRAVELVWLVAGIVLVFLALDFVFHAFGANNVGFAAFVFSVGTFFAAPFAGIFNTSYSASGNLIIWADLLAMAIYTVVAYAIARVAGMVGSRDQP